MNPSSPSEAAAPSLPSLRLPDLSGPITPESGRDYLAEGRRRLRALHEAGTGGLDIVGGMSDLIDHLVGALSFRADRDFSHRHPRLDKSFCLVAVGGYGRRELNPHSDIDLLFLHDYRINAYIESMTETILLRMYDLHLKVGHASRSIDDCARMASGDNTVKTNLLDRRFLFGSSPLYQKFEAEIRQKVFQKNPASFFKDKIAEREARLAKYGHTIYLLEPDIKESEGGLRDLHLFRWILKVNGNVEGVHEALQRGMVSTRQRMAFRHALDFLLRVRNDLHFARGKQADRLRLDEQRRIAQAFGYPDTAGQQAVELFMRDYFSAARESKTLVEDLIDRFDEEERRRANRIFGIQLRRWVGQHFKRTSDRLGLRDPKLFETEPLQMMRMFHTAQEEGTRLDSFAREQVRANLHRVDDAYRRHPEAVSLFLQMLRRVEGIGRILMEMNDLGFLQAWIPEFAPAHHKVQFDVYHLYTVDVHSIYAAERFEKLHQGRDPDAGPILGAIVGELANLPVSLLSVLFHDIGKGRGGNHSQVGAEMMPAVAERWGLSAEEAEQMRFLVLRHLHLFNVALKRDIHDPKTIKETAELVGDAQTLKMLYVLTYCDAYATNPAEYSAWKRGLVEELYNRVMEYFHDRDRFTEDLERADLRLDAVKARLRERWLPGNFPPERVDAYFDQLPPRYFFGTAPAQIARWLMREEEFTAAPLYLRAESCPGSGYLEVAFGCPDQPRTLAKLLGVLAANGLSVLGANVNVRRDGRIFDLLYVTDVHYGIEVNPEKWERIRAQLADLIEGRTDLEAFMQPRLEALRKQAGTRIEHPARVALLNDVTDHATVIEVTGQDRVGLLYELTGVLARYALTIDIAKITTLGQRVMDVFYVHRVGGGQITDPQERAALQRDLESAMEAGRALSAPPAASADQAIPCS